MTDDQLTTNRLRRDTAEAVWAGVGAGIARRLDLAPWLVRVGFVFASLFGGLGLVLYVAGWVLIPADGDDESLLERWIQSGDGTNWLGVVLIGIAAVTLLGSVQFLDGEVVFAVALLTVGVLLYRGTFDDRSGPSPSEDEDLGPPVPSWPESPEGSASSEESEEGAARVAVQGDESRGADEDAALLAAAGLGPQPPIVPERPPPPPAPAPPARPRSMLGRLIVAALMIVLGTLAVVDNSFATVTATQYLGAAVLVIGVGQLVGAWWGRSRATIVLGVILAMALQATATFRVPVAGGFGDPLYVIESVEELEAEYRLMAGELTIDLRDLQFTGEQHLTASVTAGELIVEPPARTNLIVRSEVVAGELDVLGSRESGVDRTLERHLTVEGADATLTLDLEVGLGQLTVHLPEG